MIGSAESPRMFRRRQSTFMAGGETSDPRRPATLADVRLATLVGTTLCAVLSDAVLVTVDSAGRQTRYNLPGPGSNPRFMRWEKREMPIAPLVHPQVPIGDDVLWGPASDNVTALIAVGPFAVLLSTVQYLNLQPYLTRFNVVTKTFETRSAPDTHYVNMFALSSEEIVLCGRDGEIVKVPWQ